MYSIPTSLYFNEADHPIRNKGDYRMILDCFTVLGAVELTKQERLIACLIIFYEEVNELLDLNKLGDLDVAVKEMYWFFNCGQKESPGRNIPYKLIDWDQDSQLISSAVNKVANTEIRAVPYLHWWTFMGYYMAIGESPLSTVVGIRSKIKRHKKLEKYEQEFKRENPEYFTWNSETVEEKELDEYMKNIMENWKVGEDDG